LQTAVTFLKPDHFNGPASMSVMEGPAPAFYTFQAKALQKLSYEASPMDLKGIAQVVLSFVLKSLVSLLLYLI
jgi:hypothetical protein